MRDYVQKINLDEYRGILVISGDGLVYEVVNGLMERSDWAHAIKTPFGQIPGGSANALACSCAHLSKEAYKGLSLEQFASLTTFNMSKSVAVPVDLVVYQTAGNAKPIYSFLSFEWALIADLDLESEKYRFMGNLRFAFGAVKRVISTIINNIGLL